jgi:PAS domain S-box-containing protein
MEVLQAVAEAADLAVWELDLETGSLRTSASLHRLLGRDAAPPLWTAKVLEEHLFPDDVPKFRRAMARAAEEGLLRCEVRVRHRDGRIGWIAMSGRVIEGRRLAGVLQDATQRKGSEPLLQERDAQFSAMFDTSSVGMAQADPMSGRLLRVNNCLCSMLGYADEQLLGRRLESVMHPEDRAAHRQGMESLVRGEQKVLETELRLLRRGGGIVWSHISFNVIRDAGGLPLRVAAVLMNITERKLAEQALLDREAELDQVRESLEQRVDERTTALADANAVQRLEISERSRSEQQVRELLERQVQAVEDERSRIARELHDTLGQHLAALAIELRAVVESEQPSPSMRRRLVKIRALMRRMEDELDRLSYELRPLALDDLGLDDALRSHAQAWAKESGIPIDVHTHGLRTGRLAPVVETTVYRVVQETLTNVRKHAGASRVGLIVERRPGELRVVVEDDGEGFDAANVVSERGRRLGLRGMAERARLVAGHLEVESVAGRGTTVYLSIPLSEEADGGDAADAV